MKIDRARLTESLVQFALTGNGVVVGAPGVGKTFSMIEAGKLLYEANSPVLLMPLDQLGNVTGQELSEYLSHPGDVVEKLVEESRSFAADQIGVLLIDGFDATRNETARTNALWLIRRAIADLRGKWNVVVSVRRYDARKSNDLLRMFPPLEIGGMGAPWTSPDIPCRNFEVPQLSREEMETAAHDVGLHSNPDGSFGPIEPLLRIPFHLWLVERILIAGDRPEVSDVRLASSQGALLDLYWATYVSGAVDGESREVLIAHAVSAMLANQALVVTLEEAFRPGLSDALTGLLRDEVLARPPTTPAAVQFSHNILFDDAVSRQIPSNSAGLVTFLAEDPSRVYFLRPSLVFYYSRLWHRDRRQFWTVYWDLLGTQSVGIRLAARLIPTWVIALESRRPSDPLPIIESPVPQEVRLVAASLLLKAIRTDGSQSDARWLDFLAGLSARMHPAVAGELIVVSSEAVEGLSAEAPVSQLSTYALVARTVLEYAWDRPDRRWGEGPDRVAANFAVPTLARTLAAAPAEGADLIRRLIKFVTDEPDFPVDYFYRLANNIESIAKVSEELATLVYTVAFTHREESRAPTHMGGYVVALTSNRRQDYELIQYRLVEYAPTFIREHGHAAITAIVRLTNESVETDHVRPNLRDGFTSASLVNTFAFRGRTARLLPDLSYIWDESHYPDRNVQLAGGVFDRLAEASDNSDMATIESALDIFRDEALVAFWWRRLLKLGASRPGVFAHRLHELCLAKPILASSDVIHELGEFVEKSAPNWSPAELAEVEAAILALPPETSDRRHDLLIMFRDRLIALLPQELLQSDAAVALRRELEDSGAPPKNRPLFEVEETSSTYTHREWLQDQGVDLEAPGNNTVEQLASSLDRFTSEWQNRTPTAEALRSALPQALELLNALDSDAPPSEVMSTSAWASATGWAEVGSRLCPLLPDDLFVIIRSVLLRGSRHRSPEPDADADTKYTSPSWYPAPRFHAAQGVARLAVQHPDAELFAAVAGLCRDPVPGVRYLAVSSALHLLPSQAEQFWSSVQPLIESERNQVVLSALVRALAGAMRYERERALSEFRNVVDRMLLAEPPDAVQPSIDLVAQLDLQEGDLWAAGLVNRFIADPVRFREPLAEVGHVLGRQFRRPVLESPTLRLAVDRATEIVANIQIGVAAYVSAGEADQSVVRDLLSIVDHFAAEIFFGAELHATPDVPSPSEGIHQTRALLFRALQPLLNAMVALGEGDRPMLLAPTAHYLMQFIHSVVGTDTDAALELSARLAEASVGGGYTLDSLAISEVVALVEEVLADHPELLRSASTMNSVERLLMAFAEVGWPQALALVWRLDEVFR